MQATCGMYTTEYEFGKMTVFRTYILRDTIEISEFSQTFFTKILVQTFSERYQNRVYEKLESFLYATARFCHSVF